MKKLLFVTTALVALGAGPAHADPVTSWMATTIFGAFSAATATALAQMTLGLGLNLLVGGVVMAVADTGVRANVQFDVEFGDDTPLAFTVGEYVTAGKRKYIGSWGKNTRFVTEVIEVSCLPQGLAGLWVDDEPGEWAADAKAHAFVSTVSDGGITGDTAGDTLLPKKVKNLAFSATSALPSANHLYLGRCVTNYEDGDPRICVRWYDGTQDAADPFLVWVFGEDADYPWTADHVGTGKAYAIVTTRFDDDTLSSYPSYLWQPEPLPMYDPRLDTTAGGSGAHRWGDRSTYAATTNASVIAYNLARGVYLGEEWIFGGRNLAAWRLPFAEWIAAMNACDAGIALADGGSEPAYRCGAQITVDMEPLGVLEEIGRAANMRFAEVGGMLLPQVDLPAASVLSITDDDIVITEGQSFTPFAPVSETYNALAATYPEPSEKWASRDAPEYVDADATAEDGGRYLPTAVSYGAAPYANQVQRLMRSQMRDYRRMRQHAFQLPPKAYGLQPLDKISWTSARNGYVAKEFLVEAVQKLPGMCVAVRLREVDAGDYDWSPDYQLPHVTVTPVNPIEAVQEIEGWTAIGTTILGEDGGARLPAILVGCASGEVGIESVRVQVRRPAAETCVVDVMRPYDAPYSWTVTGVAAATTYEVRGELVSSIAGQSVWSDWISVTTPDVRVTVVDLEDQVQAWLADLSTWIEGGVNDLPAELSQLAAGIAAEAQARADEAAQLAEDLAAEAGARATEAAQIAANVQDVADALAAEASVRVTEAAEAAQRLRETRDRVTALVAEVIDLAAADHAAREEIRRSLSVQVETMRASYDEQIVVLADADVAAVARIETLEAVSDDLSAEIQQVAQARVDGDDALAALITAMSVGTATQFDQASIWYFDDDVEGWTGGSWGSGGYMVPSSALLSPGGLAIDCAKYSQVRLRVQRTGTPTWTGTLRWWVAGVEATISIPEPDWSDDAGLITVAPGWAGTVDQVGLDLPVSGIVIDWIAIGRPAPGASSADLSALQQAMVSADEALAEDIAQLQADLVDAEGATEAVASAVDGLTARVTATEGSLTSQSTAITALQSGVDDLEAGAAALADAVDTLTTEVQGGEDAQTAQAGSIRSLRSQLSGVAAELLDTLAQTAAETQAVRVYVATASEQLVTRVDATDAAVDIVAEAVTMLEAAIPGLASSTALDTLSTRVLVTEGAITLQGAAITTLQNDLADLSDEVDAKAAASALSELQSTVTSQGGTITSQGSQITSISNEVTTARGGAANLDTRLDGIDTTLGTKASASALSALTSTVTTQAATITSQGSAITTLQNDLADLSDEVGAKAAASALSELQSTVTSQGGAITSQGSQITSISNEVTTARGGAANLDTRLDGIDTTLGTKASASALSALTSTVTTQAATITSQGSAITTLQNDLADLSDEVDAKAAASALSELQSTVTSQGGAITSQGSQITSISNEVTTARGGAANLDTRLDGIDTTLGTKASASALSALTSTVTTQAATITSQGSAITTLQNDLADLSDEVGAKAAASALSELQSTVTSQGGAITSQGSQITSISNEVTTARGGAANLDTRLDGIDTTLGTKASASALSALTSTVTTQGNQIVAQADSLTDLSASVDGVTAAGLLRVSVETTPSGALSRIGLVAKASASEGNWRAAALYLEAVTGAKSRVLIDADLFAITHSGGTSLPFVVTDGVVYLGDVQVRNLTAESIVSGSLSRHAIVSADAVTANSADWTTICETTLAGLEEDATVHGTLGFVMTRSGANFPSNVEFQLVVAGVVVASFVRNKFGTDGGQRIVWPFMAAVSAGDVTITLRMCNTDGGGVTEAIISAWAAMR